jgi:hypothetical protein
MTEEQATPVASLAKLISVARAALTEDIVPNVPAERRYTALMLGNALGIATRELEAGNRPREEALERLQALYPDAPREPDLEALERRLAADIRGGTHDSGATHEAVAAYLEARTRDQVAISNPRYLQAPA